MTEQTKGLGHAEFEGVEQAEHDPSRFIARCDECGWHGVSKTPALARSYRLRHKRSHRAE